MIQITHNVPVSAGDLHLGLNESKTVTVEIHTTGTFWMVPNVPTGAALPNPQTTEVFGVDYALSDPAGNVIGRSTGGSAAHFCSITMAILDRVRDAAGYIRQPWTLEVTNRTTAAVDGLTLDVLIYEVPGSSSAPPLLNGVSVALQPKVSQTLPFSLNRLGEIRIDMVLQPANALPLVELLDPAGAVVPTHSPAGWVSPAGTLSLVSNAIDLARLHQAHREGAHWSVRLTSNIAVSCHVTAQVYDMLIIPSAVLQTRLDAVFGATGTKLTISADQDRVGEAHHSFLCLIIHDQDVVDFFDSIGIIDTLEGTDRRLRTPEGKSTSPAPLQQSPASAGSVYRIVDLGMLAPSGHDAYLKNFQTVSIRATVGGPENDPLCRVRLAIKFTDLFTVDLDDSPDLEIRGLACDFDLIATWMKETGHISLVPAEPHNGALTIGSTNWINSPDFVVDWVSDDPKSLLRSRTTAALSTLKDYLETFTENLFFQFMGGSYDFTPTIQWWNQCFVLGYVAGEEEPVGTLNPNYHPGAPPTLAPPHLGALLPHPPQPAALDAEGAQALSPETDFGPGGFTPGSTPNWHSPNLAKVDHIVVFMKENRSFDHVLGHLSLTEGRTDVDGLTEAIVGSFPEGSRPRPFPLVPVTPDTPSDDYFPFDPDHGFEPVAREIDNPGGPPMRGFIPQFVLDYPWLPMDANTRRQQHPPIPPNFMPFQADAIMGYHTPATVLYYSTLAKEYTVCDRWFSSHPGPTFPNRFFFLSGKLDTQRSGEPQRDNGISGLTLNKHRTLFDELTARGITWTYYESPPDVTMLRVFARYAFDDRHIRPVAEFFPAPRRGNCLR